MSLLCRWRHVLLKRWAWRWAQRRATASGSRTARASARASSTWLTACCCGSSSPSPTSRPTASSWSVGGAIFAHAHSVLVAAILPSFFFFSEYTKNALFSALPRSAFLCSVSFMSLFPKTDAKYSGTWLAGRRLVLFLYVPTHSTVISFAQVIFISIPLRSNFQTRVFEASEQNVSYCFSFFL